MTKLFFVSSLLICSVSSSAFAYISTINQGNTENFYVSCGPRIHYQGQADGVVIHKTFPFTATIQYGRYGENKPGQFTVKKTEAADLTIETYQAAGFSLVVDVRHSSAVFDGVVGGVKVHLSGLTCQFNEFGPHPGVTMGN